MTHDTCDQGDEKKWDDQQKNNDKDKDNDKDFWTPRHLRTIKVWGHQGGNTKEVRDMVGEY